MDRVSALSPQRRALHHKIFSTALANAKACVARDGDAAARWALLSAEIADSMGCGTLMSAELEELLLSLAAGIPLPTRGTPSSQRRWLHVFSETFGIGGHTALATRWIAQDSGPDQHSLILTFQEAKAVPDTLKSAVQSKGGSIHALGALKSLTERARRLREIAWHDFDVVVLHIHMWDVVPLLAFGVPGGPPVLLLNHADHTFWLGASVADSVINLRQSSQEVTEKSRGVNRHDYLPIPLSPPTVETSSAENTIRSELSIPAQAPVFLTVGSNFKYLKVGEIDFIGTACRLLEKVPTAYLIAVGPHADQPDWRAAHKATGGRLIAVGPQQVLARYFAAADIYLEGFPFGSLTALLEAGLADLPCIRAPMACPPPFTSDGEALELLPQPETMAAYIDEAAALAASPAGRRRQSVALKQAIYRVHLGARWQNSLDAIKAKIPAQHSIYRTATQTYLPVWDQYWTPYLERKFNGDPLLYFYSLGSRYGLTVRPTLRMALASRAAASQDRPRGAPGPIALLLLGRLIEPIAGILPYSRNQVNPGWWPRVILQYWYSRYIGWRFKGHNAKKNEITT